MNALNESAMWETAYWELKNATSEQSDLEPKAKQAEVSDAS